MEISRLEITSADKHTHTHTHLSDILFPVETPRKTKLGNGYWYIKTTMFHIGYSNLVLMWMKKAETQTNGTVHGKLSSHV